MANYGDGFHKNMFNGNIIMGLNEARAQMAKASRLLMKGYHGVGTGTKTHDYDYSHFERLFMLPYLIRDVDSAVDMLARCSIALDATTAINEMLKLMREKIELQRELEFRQEAFDKIPKVDRELLYLKFRKRYSYERIAEMKNLSIRTILRHITPYGLLRDSAVVETLDTKIITIPNDFTIKCCKEAV